MEHHAVSRSSSKARRRSTKPSVRTARRPVIVPTPQKNAQPPAALRRMRGAVGTGDPCFAEVAGSKSTSSWASVPGWRGHDQGRWHLARSLGAPKRPDPVNSIAPSAMDLGATDEELLGKVPTNHRVNSAETTRCRGSVCATQYHSDHDRV